MSMLALFQLILLSQPGHCECETGHAAHKMAIDSVVITEIMQNPNAVADAAGEWFEIFNPGATSVNLNGWTIRDNGSDSHTLSADLIVPSGGYAVLGNNANTTTNGGIAVDYQYTGFTLGNADDEVILVRADATTADEVWYDGGSAWPDPTGASMVLASAALDNNQAANWGTSTEVLPSGDLGTPGSGPDSVVAATIVITEIMQNPSAVADGAGEWFEVYNPGPGSVNMNGWTIRDNGSDSHTIASDVIISAGSHAVLGNNGNATTNGGITVAYQYSGIALANADDEIILERADASLADEVWYTGAAPWPNPTGASMELTDVGLDNNAGANWVTATNTLPSGDLGTPGSGPGSGSGGNGAPLVDAGADQVFSWSGSTLSTTLNGSAIDPESDPFTLQWTLIAGNAANVTIDSPTTAATSVDITALGLYTFQLSADDGTDVGSDTLLINVRTMPQSNGVYITCFGNLHSHSSYSDGNQGGNPSFNGAAAAFRYARDNGGLDWLLVSDHNHATAGMAIANYHAGVAEADAVDAESSAFVAIYGTEWGTISTGGHVIYSDPQLWGWEPGNYDVFVDKGDYTGLFSQINDVDGWASLCHPGSSDFGGIFNNAYNAAWDDAISLISVKSGPAFATATDFSEPSASNYLSYYYDLLKLGYHVGPTGDQDTHNTNWGLANEQRTAVLAEDLTRPSILAALKAGRVYAAEDRNILLDFTADYGGTAYAMSSVLVAGIGQSVTFDVAVSDPDGESTATLSLLSGQVGGASVSPVATVSGSVLSHNFVPAAADENHFFLVAVTQADGQQAWSAPIWVETVASANLPPAADFGFTTDNLVASFTDASSDSDGSIVAWDWDFGDGTGSTLQNPDHGYAAAGSYRVVLTVTDSGSAQDSTSQEVSVTAPSSSWVTLASDDFESGWGPYTDGGSDCQRSAADAAFAHGGTYCVRLRDNSGSASAFYTTTATNWSAYSELRVDFWFIANGLENGEDFLVEIWNGSAWQVIAAYAAGSHFANGVFVNESLVVSGLNLSSARIRFRCDASANDDTVYFDDIVISGR